MEIERRHAPVSGELLEYLRTNPAAQQAEGGVHVHVHHHYAPPEPAPVGPVHQGPQPTVAEKVLPWVWTALGACIIGTICAAILTAVVVAVIALLATVALLAVVIAHMVRSYGDTEEIRGRAAEAKARAEVMVNGKKNRGR